MATNFRTQTGGDRLFSFLDQSLRVIGGVRLGGSGRPAPKPPAGAGAEPLTSFEQRHAAALMRVTHAGEIAAQALYQGQALVARDAATRAHLLAAAREEVDHLDWCADRVRDLGSRTSLLTPLWYAGSATIGAVAGLASDRVSLGFVAETERQVEGHLAEHLDRLPRADLESRAILEQMKADEVKHGREALARGGVALPRPVQQAMRLVARVMTRTAYYV
ncbi:MAG: 2-polyprenyl-3-methyl-6-methoxy-1,4-benzoquinone monooxygenase [Pseudomonadota bacterium]